MMREKKRRSLYLLDVDLFKGSLKVEFPKEQPLAVLDGQTLISEYRHTAGSAFDIIGAAADYYVEYHRTQELSSRIAAEESALDARNREAERQVDIKLREYAKQLKIQMETWQQELDLQVQQAETLAQELVSETEPRRWLWREHQLVQLLLVDDISHLHDVQTVMQDLVRMGILDREEHYLRLDEERMHLLRHANKLRKILLG